MENLLNQTVMAEKNEEDQDSFKRLPEEIITSHIFQRISEAKSLCRISMVSKHFSDLVYKSHSVSVKIPVRISLEELNVLKRLLKFHSLSFPGKVRYLIVNTPLRWVRSLFCSIMKRSSPRTQHSLSTSSFLIPVTEFLKKFISMRSLYLEYDYPKNSVFDGKSIFKWRMDSKFDSLVFLTATSLDDHNVAATDHEEEDPANDEDEDVDVDILTREMSEFLLTGVRCQFAIAKDWFSMVKNLVPLLTESLQRVLVIDSKKQGKMDYGENDLIELREKNPDFLSKETRMRFWHAKVVKLPLSGRVMKKVTLHLLQGKNSSDNVDDFLLAKQVFDGEDEQVFAEAATEMFNKDVLFDEVVWKQEDS